MREKEIEGERERGGISERVNPENIFIEKLQRKNQKDMSCYKVLWTFRRVGLS